MQQQPEFDYPQPSNQFTPQYQQPPQWQQLQPWSPQQHQYPQHPYYPSQPHYPQQWQPQPYYSQPYYPPPMPQQMTMNQFVNVTNMRTQQYSCLLRALYFMFIGWWLGLIWAIIAVLFCATIIGLPIGMVMFNFLPAVLTLQQH